MVCIHLGQIDNNLIPIIIGSVFCFFNRLLNQVNPELYKNPILTNICISCSRFLTLIPFIILKIRSKGIRSNIDIEKNKTISLIYNNQESIKGKYKFILLSAVIYLIQSIFFALSFDAQTNAWIWIILIASIFYYFIFKVKLYKHHYLSIILIILFGLIIDISTKAIIDDANNKPIALVMKYLKEILFSLYNVIAKYVMEKKFVSVYEFSFYIGLFNLIFLIIFAIIDYNYFSIYIYIYKEYFDNINYKEILKILGVLFTQLGINLGSLFTTKNCSPCHVFIIFVFGQIAYYIYFNYEYIILVTICLIIILFLSLIFNEIIEIDIFKLSYNTKRNIMKRAENDALIKNLDEDNESIHGNTENNNSNSFNNNSNSFNNNSNSLND